MCASTVRTAWTSGLAWLVLAGFAGLMGGCATSQEKLLPTQPGRTMASIWHQATQGSGVPGSSGSARTSSLIAARAALRRPLSPPPRADQVRAGYTRDAANAIQSQFRRVPNPDIALYIYPHLAGGASEQVPVPGYTTVFPLYDRPHYAQPGEPSIAPATHVAAASAP